MRETKLTEDKFSEESLYEPIRENLIPVFRKYIIPDKKPVYQDSLDEPEKLVYLEITGNKRAFSEILKKGFSDETLNIINNEGKFPDLTGFVKRKRGGKKELITVEVKKGTIKLRDVIQARLYQELFNAKFGLLISAEGIQEERVRFLLDNKIGRWIRGDVIIMHYYRNFYPQKKWLEIHPRFEKKIPDIFRRFCKST